MGLFISLPVMALENLSPLQSFHQLSPYMNESVSKTPLKTLESFYKKEHFTLFESGQVRPLGLSPNGEKLFALNTPNNTLEVFKIKKNGELKKLQDIRVGLEPVALAVRNNGEIWVVNHLSDSVSIVKKKKQSYQVVKTLWVGDEPRDIVFAGENNNRAFITTAHRGQNTPFNKNLTTPGIGRADVWVFDAKQAAKRKSTQPKPLNIITLFTDTPRALAVSPDGQHVYAAGFHTGNQTTIIPEEIVTALLFNDIDVRLPPLTNASGEEQPIVGIIVKFDGTHWVDELGRHWDEAVKFNLPDKDVFKIDALANPPQLVEDHLSSFSQVGTILYNMIVNPKTGALYVTNTDAQNHRRFEGAGEFSGQTLRGHLHESRITVIKPDGSVNPRHLNKHIDYEHCCDEPDNATNRKSVSMPLEMALTQDGETLYFTAYGSNKIGIMNTTELEEDSFIPNEKNSIPLPSAGGPSGLVINEENNKLYVLTRFDNTLHVIDLNSKTVQASKGMYNPEPEHIVKGRPFLYDAAFTSSNGENSCGSCHVFGDFDSLAWDLGDPDGANVDNLGPFKLEFLPSFNNTSPHFRSMKGPMTTQSLRGLANHGPMHWRGDRTGGFTENSAQPDQGAFDEAEAFRQFNPAFEGLIGRSEALSPEEMQAFTDFALEIFYPPNPIRSLDNKLTPEQTSAQERYFGEVSDFLLNCNGCHTHNPIANAEFDVPYPGFFGTDGTYVSDGFTQVFKIPHLRNMYQKVGMFGMNENFLVNPETEEGNAHQGDQIRGFGFRHDGAFDTLFRFFQLIFFNHQAEPDEEGQVNPGGFPLNTIGDHERRQMESLMLAFDSNLKPIVGQQITVNAFTVDKGLDRILLMIFQSHQQVCDLVVNSSDGDYLYLGEGLFQAEYKGEILSSSELYQTIKFSPKHDYTFMCAPPGSGLRLSIDQDLDGKLDGEI